MRSGALRSEVIVALLVTLAFTACRADDAGMTSTTPDVDTTRATPSTTSFPATSTTTPTDRFASLDNMIDEWAADNDPVGVAAAALYPDGRLWLGAAGLADREKGTAIDPSGRFEIGSITKTFMAVLTLRLAEEGIVQLDDPVSAFVPDFPEAESTTLRMLLGHRAGVYDPTSELVSDREGPPDPERVFTPEEILQAAAAHSPVFPPGSQHDYSNANYWVLAAALEAATATDIGSLLDQYLIGPMGLGATMMFDSSLPDVELVNAYKDLDLDGVADPMGARPLPGFITPAWTAGAMISNANDLVTFLDGVFAGEIISRTSVDELTNTANGGGNYALGIYTSGGYWGHDGGIAGYLSAVFHDPRTGVTVAVLTNRFGPQAPQADALSLRLLPVAGRLAGD